MVYLDTSGFVDLMKLEVNVGRDKVKPPFLEIQLSYLIFEQHIPAIIYSSSKTLYFVKSSELTKMEVQ